MSDVELPKSWSAGVLADLCTLSSASALPAESGAPIYVGLEHVDSGAFSLTRWASPQAFKSNAFVFQSGDVLYGKLRPYLDKAVIAPGAGVCSTELLVLRPKPNVPSEFLLAILHTPEFIAYAQSSADKQYPRTSWSWISQYPCPRPPPDEQQKIAAVLGKVQAAVAVEGDLVRVARELKQAALRHLFTRGLRNEESMEMAIGHAPKSWETSTLGELCSHAESAIQTGPFGSQLHAADYVANGVPVVNPTHMKENRINHQDVPQITAIKAAELRRHKLREGDILFARRGEIGRQGLVTSAEEGWMCGTGCFLVRLANPKTIPAFFSAYFSTQPVITWLEANAAGAIMPNLNSTVLSQMPVAFPSPAEQREIAALLATLDAKIAHHEARQALLRELFRTLLHDLLTARRRVTSLNLDHFADASKMIAASAP